MAPNLQFCFGWSAFDIGDIFILLIALLIGCYVSYQGYIGLHTNKSVSHCTKIAYISMISFYFIASIGFFFNLVFDHHFKNYRFLTNDEIYNQSALSLLRYSIADITFVSYFCILTLLCNVLIIRLISTFRNSIFAMSKCGANIFYFIVIISVTCLFIGFGFSGSKPVLGAALQTFSGLAYLITSGVMVIIFVNKLNHLILSTHDNDTKDSESAKLNELQIKLIDTATKYVILSFIGFASTLLSVLTNIGIRFIWNCVLHRICFVWAIKLDIMINMMCFYLQFSFSQRDYKKLCFCFDKLLKRNMETTALIEMKQSMERESQNHGIVSTASSNSIDMQMS